uniref:Uncharacterized protein n=1 Tax=viral metagenome TaxID=1070528 RepID=A0A6M3LY49_9ZZZZ
MLRSTWNIIPQVGTPTHLLTGRHLRYGQRCADPRNVRIIAVDGVMTVSTIDSPQLTIRTPIDSQAGSSLWTAAHFADEYDQGTAWEGLDWSLAYVPASLFLSLYHAPAQPIAA